MKRHESEKGQFLVLFGVFGMLLLILIIGAFWLDHQEVGQEIGTRQMAVDDACWNAAVTLAMGGNWYGQALNTLAAEGYGALGTDITIGNGEVHGIPVPIIRVSVNGPTQTAFHQFLGAQLPWEVSARAMCTSGLGGVMPILIKEYETKQPGWTWGATVVMFGDGWDPNVGPNQSPTGIGNPDIICVDGGPLGDCNTRIYRDPPAPAGSQVNTLKDVVMGYMTGGYDGPLHPAGTFIPRQSGLSDHQTVQAFLSAHPDGSYVAVMVINDGDVYNGADGFDNVEIIGYAIFQVDAHDANTVWGHPVTPILSPTEVLDYPVQPMLLTWR